MLPVEDVGVNKKLERIEVQETGGFQNAYIFADRQKIHNKDDDDATIIHDRLEQKSKTPRREAMGGRGIRTVEGEGPTSRRRTSNNNSNNIIIIIVIEQHLAERF